MAQELQAVYRPGLRNHNGEHQYGRRGICGGSVEEEADGIMTFFQQGFAILLWGPPEEDLVNKLNDALASEPSSEGQFFWRGKYRSPLSEALINFVMHGISEETVCFQR